MRALVATIAACCVLAAAVTEAHHTMFGPRALSPTCGWMDADTSRDLRNVSTFCNESIPLQWVVRSAAANRERLWLEAPAELLTRLRERDPEARQTVSRWLERWQQITGTRGASVILIRQHVDVATAESTMAGDVIRVR